MVREFLINDPILADAFHHGHWRRIGAVRRFHGRSSISCFRNSAQSSADPLQTCILHPSDFRY
jgi:hypothetical protein